MKTLGSGGFGTVALQKSDAGKLRAVKKIWKAQAKIDYSRELLVLTKVAHVRILGSGSWGRLHDMIK